MLCGVADVVVLAVGGVGVVGVVVIIGVAVVVAVVVFVEYDIHTMFVVIYYSDGAAVRVVV